ncbi:MAG: hypothetical protein ABSE51_00710 [Terracidiphilus sp.]
MTKIDFMSYDQSLPRARRAVLTAIPPDRTTVKAYHRELLDIFRKEIDFRKSLSSREVVDEADYFESIYHCALMRYLIGDPADVLLMWEAKHIDMDMSCGFDIQFTVGAGVSETIAHLTAHSHAKIADFLQGLRAHKDFDNLEKWERFRIGLLLWEPIFLLSDEGHATKDFSNCAQESGSLMGQ